MYWLKKQYIYLLRKRTNDGCELPSFAGSCRLYPSQYILRYRENCFARPCSSAGARVIMVSSTAENASSILIGGTNRTDHNIPNTAFHFADVWGSFKRLHRRVTACEKKKQKILNIVVEKLKWFCFNQNFIVYYMIILFNLL